jgi:hypothetical protein
VIHHAKWAVAAVCAYEVAAITTDLVPTVSHICHERRWLTPVVLGGLAVHLLIRPRTQGEPCRTR